MISAVGEATLSSVDDMTVFSYGDKVIRFKTSPRLERYVCVKLWDKGYIVCAAKYDGRDEPEEEYIDLVPILKDLYIDVASFLEPIQKVRVCNDTKYISCGYSDTSLDSSDR